MEPQPLHDSRLTDAEVDALVAELTVDLEPESEAVFIRCLTVGLVDGDVIQSTDAGTLLLRTPRAEIDARIATIRRHVAAGVPLAEAVLLAVPDA